MSLRSEDDVLVVDGIGEVVHGVFFGHAESGGDQAGVSAVGEIGDPEPLLPAERVAPVPIRGSVAEPIVAQNPPRGRFQRGRPQTRALPCGRRA
jgi:hypothetical protein